MSTLGRILAIDYGAKHIGLAVSDVNRQMAFSRGVLRNSKQPNEINDLFKKIFEMCQLENIKLLLVGLPMSIEGVDTVQTLKIKEFIGNLKQYFSKNNFDLPVEYIDESFSSSEARSKLAEIGVKGKDMKSTEDEMSAIILIHRYIDFKP